jgi:hypothetical protein
VTVKDLSPTNSSSVRKSTVGSSLLARWRLWSADRSSTTTVYVPGAICDTFLPEASFRVMVKPSFVPTIAVRAGVSARRAPAGRTSTSAQMMTIPVRRTRPTAAHTVGARGLRSTS